MFPVGLYWWWCFPAESAPGRWVAAERSVREFQRAAVLCGRKQAQIFRPPIPKSLQIALLPLSFTSIKGQTGQIPPGSC
ncbi:hypothetical protein PGIGA_G00189290 [Pangasianodon gigas]|uniref:Uncharacterized protein n=1 Tax=Pangasianodon gigas TaxID=30993 RepID=A0ACC5WBQ0_PANGG|nr:hypothetical protein [Pangasianodon gigas]